ncbi:MAG: hypothetical protein DDT19_02830 [Syntrophomonadaceae bacterium]|nr:hypothetical protein [Bacillota bacterium]
MVKIRVIFIILIAGVLASLLFYGVEAFAGTLSCSVTTAAACTGTVIWRMSGPTNAHAELPGQATGAYASNVVCCTGVPGLGNACTGTFAIALKLSGVTNAHVEQNTQVNYGHNACIQVPSGGSVSVGYQATDCTGFHTTLGSMSAVTNAHVGNPAAYTTKICASATAAAAQTITFSFPAGNTVALGTLSPTAVRTGSHTILVGTNATSGVAVTYSGRTLTSGVHTITALSAGGTSTVGTEQFGINAVANTIPAVGAACSGTAPIAAAATGYATANNFRFVSGETIISSTGPINNTTCTISYIANITAVTEAGSYSTALTYVATATF